MIYQFDVDDKNTATGALLVYAIYRSRDRSRYKVSPDMWARIERFTKSAAKRAGTIPRFIESLKPRLCCYTVHPKWMRAGIKGLTEIIDSTGHANFMESADSREFLTRVVRDSNESEVIRQLYQETAWIILLVRERLEREKPIESKFEEV